MSTIHRGSCLCGGVRYEYAGGFDLFTLCHCMQCRKAQGSAYAAVLPIAAADFRLLQGEALLKAYSSSHGKERVFCSNCGSPLFSRLLARPELLRLRAGTLDTPLPVRPQAHIFAASKAEWDDILDGVPQYAERPSN